MKSLIWKVEDEAWDSVFKLTPSIDHADGQDHTLSSKNINEYF